MSIYQQFRTDSDKEIEGIVLDYDDTRITIARAGGNNKKFNKAMEKHTAPMRRSIRLGTVTENIAEKALIEVYAESVILKWETLVGKEWKEGIQNPKKGEPLLPFTVNNVKNTLQMLPELFYDIQEQACYVRNFREDLIEADVKN